MPCFSPTPEEAEEGRYFENRHYMYHEAEKLLDKETVYMLRTTYWLMYIDNEPLCHICKYLSIKQMGSISAKANSENYLDKNWPYKTLYDWHIQHCKDDETFNKQLDEKDYLGEIECEK